MVTVPPPLDPATGDKLTVTSWDAGVRDALNFLMTNYPRVHAWRSTALAVPDTSTGTLITYDSETFDTDNMHSTVSNTSRITFTTAGLYRVHIRTVLAGASYSTLQQITRKNSGGAVGGGSGVFTDFGDSGGSASGVLDGLINWYFAAGDYIETFIAQTSGASRNTNVGVGDRVFVQCEWI